MISLEAGLFSDEDIDELVAEVRWPMVRPYSVSQEDRSEFGTFADIQNSLKYDLNGINHRYQLVVLRVDTLTNKTLERAESIAKAAKTIIDQGPNHALGDGSKLDQVFVAAGLWDIASREGSVHFSEERIAETLEMLAGLQRWFTTLSKTLEADRQNMPNSRTLSKEARHELYQSLLSTFVRHWEWRPGTSNTHKKGEKVEIAGPFVRFLVFTVAKITGYATPSSVDEMLDSLVVHDFLPVSHDTREGWGMKVENNLRPPRVVS